MAAADQLVLMAEALAGTVEQGGGAGGTRRVEREEHDWGIVGTCGVMPQVPELNCLYGFDLGHVMADEALDSALQGDRRGGAARAGAVHREIEMTVLVALVDDVAAVLRDRGADPRFDQLLDLVDDVGVGRIFLDVALRSDMDASRASGCEQRRTRHEM